MRSNSKLYVARSVMFDDLRSSEVREPKKKDELGSNTMESMRRIQKELQELVKNPIDHITAFPSEDNARHWTAVIFVPEDHESVYSGGTFHLDILFGNDYPFHPPKVTFITRIFHCNISRMGSICMDLLKTQWSPAMTIQKVLLSIRSLLDDPNPEDPLAPEVADLYYSDRAKHDETARKWTLRYAK